MVGSALIASTSKGWNREPAGVVKGWAAASAALWIKDGDELVELSRGPSEDCYTVAIAHTFVRSDMWLDGRLIYSKQVAPGSIQIIPPGVTPTAVIAGPIRSLQIFLPAKIIAACCEAAGMGDAVSATLEKSANFYDPVIQGIGRGMLSEIDHQQPLSRLRVDTLGQDLAIQLLRRCCEGAGATGMGQLAPRGGLAPWQARLVTNFMQDQLAEEVSLSDLADLVGLSTAHFARAFRHSLGLPPHQWLIARRVELARTLLATTDDTVLEIALACGFSHGQHLARVFTRAFGVTPNAWRRLQRA